MAEETITRLAIYESKAVVPVQTFSPGTYTFPLQIEGNSLLSTLFVKTASGGSSVTVNYWDFGPGDGDTAGQRIDLNSHAAFSAASAPNSDRILVTGLHNKPRIEVIVTGGAMELGVYVSVISQFASDLDKALKSHGQVADLTIDKGMVAVGYDDTQGKFFFLPLKDGSLQTSSEVPGLPFNLTDSGGITADGLLQTLIDDTVPAGKIWRIRQCIVKCRAYGEFTIYADGGRIGDGTTGPEASNACFSWSPYLELTAGMQVQVKYIKNAGPVTNLTAYLQLTEHSA